jgi:hypothetical protein
MKKVILFFVFALGILCSCEKVVLKDPSTDPVNTTLSFSADVVPVIAKCDNCHTHSWTNSSVASTFYTNLVSQDYVNPTAYASSTIYTKMISDHPGTSSMAAADTDKIINWMIQGSLNN